jgi:acetyltransferase EpsM
MRHLVIGAAGHAQEVAWALDARARAEGRRVEILFFDDGIAPGALPCGLGAVVGDVAAAAAHVRRGETELVLGVALPRLKAALTTRLAALALPWTTVVHPAAIVGPNVRLGAGTYVAAGAVVTVNARIGRFATINVHAGVAHDTTLADLVTLHPHAHLSGNVQVEEGAEIGAGASVIPGVRIGPWAVLGAGGVAVRALQGGRTFVGVPARDVHSQSAPSMRRTG